jgi:hypothetical protein
VGENAELFHIRRAVAWHSESMPYDAMPNQFPSTTGGPRGFGFWPQIRLVAMSNTHDYSSEA